MRVPRIAWLISALFVGSSFAALEGCAGKFGSRTPDPEPPAPGPRPTLGPTVQQADPPPPIAGGTLLVNHATTFALASDPDRDRLELIDLASRSVTHLALRKGDEPGRATEDKNGLIHVALRRGGDVVTVDPAKKIVTERRAVCPAPRGIAYDSSDDVLFVACAGGELVKLPTTGGVATVLVPRLATDLRDVVVLPKDAYGKSGLLVSRFRSAEVLKVDRSGAVLDTFRSPDMSLSTVKAKAQAAVAWRLVAAPFGGAVMVHQRARDPKAAPVPVGSGGYTSEGGNPPTSIEDGSTIPTTTPPPVPLCQLGIVQATVSTIDAGGFVRPFPSLSRAVLPVDVAVRSTSEMIVAAPGNGKTPQLDQLYLLDRAGSVGDCMGTKKVVQPQGQAIGVTVDAGDVVYVQTREPSTLAIYENGLEQAPTVVTLADDSREDTGHSIFHSNAGGFMACASCHPEGGDDGRVWAFADSGPRRTQNFRGGLTGTEPFHWDGKLANLGALTAEVFTKRMSGMKLDLGQLAALTHWVDAVPLLPASPPLDPAAVERGRAIFQDGKTGCTSCHSGTKLTNNTSAVVGTGNAGDAFQVPSLRGLWLRAPYMHDGCAQTLADRFDPACGGDKHGNTADLDDAMRRDLIAFLETL